MNEVPEFQTHRHPLEQESVLATNKVLRNTYLLLSMTLAFSAACTVMGMSLSYGWSMGCLLGGFVMSFVVRANANSSMGLIAIFAFAGLFGAAIGPMINTYLTIYENGGAIVAQALGGTAMIFLSLSGYALVSGKDFSYMRGFLFTGLLVIFAGMIVNMFLQIPAFSLAISAGVIMVMSGLILYDTSRIINGGERNYINATISLYLSFLNIFIHLLRLLAIFTGRR